MRTITAAILIAAGAWLAAGIANAHDTKTASTITITDFPNNDADADPDGVAGVVTSSRARCERARTVKIFWIGNSDHPTSSLILIDTVRTNGQGEWSGGDVEPIGRGGKVVVTKKNVGRSGHRHICKADTDVYD